MEADFTDGEGGGTPLQDEPEYDYNIQEGREDSGTQNADGDFRGEEMEQGDTSQSDGEQDRMSVNSEPHSPDDMLQSPIGSPGSPQASPKSQTMDPPESPANSEGGPDSPRSPASPTQSGSGPGSPRSPYEGDEGPGSPVQADSQPESPSGPASPSEETQQPESPAENESAPGSPAGSDIEMEHPASPISARGSPAERSRSPSPAGSAPASPAGSAPASPDQDGSAPGSPTHDRSRSPSPAGSGRSRSASPTGSHASRSRSNSPAEGQRSRSGSPVGSPTGSPTRSRSGSPASQKSRSRSRSGSPARSQSRSPARSRSGSPASQRSRSGSPVSKGSRSRSGSPASRRSRSGSGSPARSRSVSPARSRSGSPASRGSRSRSGSPAGSDRSRSRSGSRASGRSRSGSRSHSRSRSRSGSRAGSGTPPYSPLGSRGSGSPPRSPAGSDKGGSDAEKAKGSDDESDKDDLVADIFGSSDEEEFEGFGEADVEATARKKKEKTAILSDDEGEGMATGQTTRQALPTLSDDENDEAARQDGKGDGEDLVSDFELMIMKKKEEMKSRRRKRKDFDLINDSDDLIADMINKMKVAAEEDRGLNMEKKPAIRKLKYLPTVVSQLKKADLHGAFLDCGILSTMTEWLAPLPDKSLPNLQIRQHFLKILGEFPTLNPGALKTSGIGKAVMYLYKHPKEIKENREMAGKLINDWSRPLFNLTSNYKSLSKEEREQRDYDQLPKRRRTSMEDGGMTPRKDLDKSLAGEQKALRPGDPGWIYRARVPLPSNKDYVIRPKWKTEEEGEEEPRGRRGGKKEPSRYEKQVRKFAEKKKNSKSMRAVTISIEGRNMAL